MTDAAARALEGLPSLSLPPSPPDPPRPGFPWIAAAAPVAGAFAIWAITGSALALAFAALGPLVALASMLDARRSARRDRRAHTRERLAALQRLRDEIARRHDLERAAAWSAAPTARALQGRGVPAWGPNLPGRVVVGSGVVASRVAIERAQRSEPDADDLLAVASRLTDAPVRVDLRGGIGFVGPIALARAAARASVMQVAATIDPSACILRPDGDAWAWVDELPHATRPGSSVRVRIVDRVEESRCDPGRADAAASEPSETVLAVAEQVGELPPGVGAIIRTATTRGGVLHVDGARPEPIRPEYLSEAEAREAAGRLASIARRAGIAASARALPERVELGSLLEPAGLAPRDGADRARLPATFLAGGSGPVEIDLVAGPHAIVAGTSGSGKSELLVAWITAMAAARPPDRVAFLLVDFKGGAAFEPVAGLPHVAGAVTDLDEDEAQRAVTSLRAELRHRERVLADSGAREISAVPPSVVLPRLVVVIDEFQAMIERFPELGSAVADIAARGRSLGVHLILSAQRPNGVVREQVSANCGIRMSLRVLQRADSVAVVGTDAAAHLDPSRPGRVMVDAGDARAVEAQSALADPDTIAAVAAGYAGAGPPRRPWLDRLPARIGVDDVDAVLSDADGVRSDGVRSDGPSGGSAGLVLGVADDPAEQRRRPVRWSPGVDGALLVLGSPGSGRSALLEAIAVQVEREHGPGAVVRLDGPPGRDWDRLTTLREAAVAAAGAADEVRLVVADDLDLRFAGWPDEHRFAALDAVEDLARAVRRSGPALAAAATRASALPPGLRDLLATHALLRHATRADLVHAGGDGGLHRGDAPPGSGQWNGLRAQFLHAARPPAPASDLTDAPALRLDGAACVAICSARPGPDAATIARILERGPTGGEAIRLADGPEAVARATAAFARGPAEVPVAVIGDGEAWTSNWALAATARARAHLIVHGGPAEYRALVRSSGLPPLLDGHRDQCWSVEPGEPAVRRTWPTG
ncbi:FtsK/SpoIIIE domain-containing protein [Agromyces marinus]|uniref:FtsK/SpoIIIE domain-containing protein n=1 Tax=Agromyces marinus TaxID=1389020 RepID=UPI001F1C9F3E|nr:FtsK/SpoIIIE domain-containing protein [Agromyces marinus]UIP58172.1 hypothetical protein DSM26151_10430 [Agromyces marinus]